MTAVVEVYETTDPKGAPVATVSDLVSWQWRVDDELGDFVEFTVEKANPNYGALTKGRLARFVDDGTPILDGLIGTPEMERRGEGTRADEAIEAIFICDGSVNVIGGENNAGGVVYPEYGLNRSAQDPRMFGPMQAGYNVSTWDTAVSLGRQANPTDLVGAYHGKPEEWPDGDAHWLGPTTLDADRYMQPNAQRWPIRREFTSGNARARLFVSMDNFGWLWVDGQLVIANDRFTSWSQIYTYDLTLQSGTHVIFGWIADHPWRPPNGADPTTLLLSLVGLKDDNDETGLGNVIIRTTDDGNWRTLNDPAEPPGVTPGSIPIDLRQETIDRAAAASQSTVLSNVTVTFTDAVDSDGVAWPDEIVMGLGIGTDYVQSLDEIRQFADVDVAMLPGLDLSMWTNRSVDRGLTPHTGISTITLSEAPTANPNIVASAYASETFADANVLLVGTEEGFVERSEAGATTRHEGAVVFGRQPFGEALGEFAAHIFQQRPVIGDAQFVIDDSGPVPKVDFDVTDIIVAPDHDGTYRDWKVRAIQGYSFSQTTMSLYAISCRSV